MAQEQNDLLGFNWEEGDSYFGLGPSEEVEPVIPKVKEVEEEVVVDKNKPTPKAKEEEEEEDEDYFPGSETKKPEATATNEEDDEPVESVYNDLYKDLKDAKIFKHVEIEEGTVLDPDTFAELQEEEYEIEVSERLKAWATEELDDDAKAFIKFKREGGSTAQFFATYAKTSDLPTGDIADEDYQDEVIRYQLTEEGWDKDEIEDRIEYLTTSGRKQKVAEKYDVKVKAEDTKRKQALLAQADAQKKNVKAQEEEFKNDIKSTLDSVEEIEGFKISKQDKVDVFNFLTKKEHKVSDSRSITSFQKKLAEIFQDTNKTILLAKLIQSDFDMSSFEKKIVTKKTREIKSNLEQRKGLRPSNSGSSLQGSQLADLFN